MRVFNGLFTVKNTLIAFFYVLVAILGHGFIKECITNNSYPYVFWIVVIQTLSCYAAAFSRLRSMTENDKRFDRK